MRPQLMYTAKPAIWFRVKSVLIGVTRTQNASRFTLSGSRFTIHAERFTAWTVWPIKSLSGLQAWTVWPIKSQTDYNEVVDNIVAIFHHTRTVYI